MTRTRKLSIAAAVILLVGFWLLLLAGGRPPQVSGTFLRYEDGGAVAVLQIANLNKFNIRYVCDSSHQGTNVAVSGSIDAHEVQEVRAKIQVRDSDRPFRPFIRVACVPMGHRRVRFLEQLGIDTDPQLGQVLIELPRR